MTISESISLRVFPIKLDSTFVSDVVAIEGLDGAFLKVVRQEYGGQVSTHVRCDVSSGAVVNVRPGAFKPNGECSGQWEGDRQIVGGRRR